MKLLHGILNLLFPPKCVLCGSLLENEELDLCRSCRMETPDWHRRESSLPFLDSYTAVWYYERNVRSSLLRFKFGGARRYAPAYGRMLAMTILREYPEGFDLLTWIPVSPLRRLRRGYDQAQLLARAVGRELGIAPVALVKKIRHNPAQSGLKDKARRRANVQGAYRLRNDASVAGKKILLIDDILTTGATAGEVARVLLTAGAGEVYCAAVAAARKD